MICLRFNCTSFIFALAGLLLVLSGEVRGQEIPRDTYLKFVPLSYPRLVQQNEATDALHLYGNREDPTYRDVNPVDGIDDDRHDILLSLAVRFAPFLVQNTTNIPVNFDAYIDNSESFQLYLDTWDASGEESRLVQMDSINFSALGQFVNQSSPAAKGRESQDRKLIELLEQFSPRTPRRKAFEEPLVRQRPDLFTVLFFDFPGEGPKTWEKAYRPAFEKVPEHKRNAFPHSYVHPFLTQVMDGEGSVPAYELVLQYWLYYPTNDGGNNHEGDWEHMNVVVAPRSMVERPLTAETIDRILTGALPATDDAQDPLVIRRVEYYFHHFVMTLDYADPNVYVPRSEWKADIKGRSQTHVQIHEIWKDTRHMAYVDDEETRVNTHPIGYIGADNKGFDQALSAPGGKNRNSHGTFPFPGRYHNIGPAGATEQISVQLDSRKFWKQLESNRVTSGPEFKRGSVIGLADPERLRIVPDWERIIDHTRQDAGARRDWSWLVLPVRWGYPATESPFSGILPHADTGNLAPVGPSFSSGWNVSGAAPGFHVYQPHTFPSVFPLGLQDSFRNDFGYFNFTLPLLFNLPPLDFLTRIATYPFKLAFGKRDPVYYPKEGVPFRFFGLSSGLTTQIFDEDFNALAFNPTQYDEFILRFVGHIVVNGADSTTAAVSGTDFKSNSVGPFFQIVFFIGGRFASENTVRNMRPSFGTTVNFNNIPSYTYRAQMNFWEYEGSLRYSFSPSRVQPYLKAGYGWSWYRLEDVEANGERFEAAESDWIKPKSIWPNVWHIGLGIEIIPWKREGTFPGGMEAAFRVEYGWYSQDLGLDLSSVPLDKLAIAFPTLGDVPGTGRVSRHDFVFGVTLSF